MHMKKMLILAMTFVMACSSVMAQTELNSRVDKTTMKEAKRLRKEGWDVKPGLLPLEKQLEKSFIMQYEYDEEMNPLYIFGSAMAVGANYDAAKTAAMSLAITDLAGHIQTDVTALVENTVANKELSAGDATSITETVMTSQSLISQSISRVITVVECYRINEKNNNEVQVRVAYKSEMARAIVRRVVRQQLEEQGIDLHEQLDKVLGF